MIAATTMDSVSVSIFVSVFLGVFSGAINYAAANSRKSVRASEGRKADRQAGEHSRRRMLCLEIFGPLQGGPSG